MTTINYINDVHLDFYVNYTTNPKKLKRRMDAFIDTLFKKQKLGDILIIAGDFGHVNAVSQLFLEWVAPLYDRIFATYGNHDLYLISKTDQRKFGHSHARIEDLIERTAHITKLTWLTEGEVFEYDGLTISGHPMPALPQTPEEQLFYRQSMNDFHYIKYIHRYGLPEFHQEGMRAYRSLPDDLDIFISHYPLIRTPEFRNDASQGSYYNMMNELKAHHYFFGHVHQRDDFERAGHHFHTHAIGYPQEGLDASLGYIEIKKDPVE